MNRPPEPIAGPVRSRAWLVSNRPRLTSLPTEIVCLATFLMLSSCGPAITVPQPYDEESILEVMFRYQMEHCYKSRNPQVYFLSRSGKDLSDGCMERLKGSRPVRKRSQMTGEWERDIFLDVESIKWINRAEAQVDGSCVANGLDGHGYVYHVVLENAGWKVKSSQFKWIA